MLRSIVDTGTVKYFADCVSYKNFALRGGGSSDSICFIVVSRRRKSMSSRSAFEPIEIWRGNVQYFNNGLAGGEPAPWRRPLAAPEVAIDTSLIVEGDNGPGSRLLAEAPSGKPELGVGKGSEFRRTGRKPRGKVSVLVGVV